MTVALRTLAIAIVTSASALQSGGTSVVALRTPTIIVIGGDSKYVAGTQAGLICKVRVAKDTAYGESGILWVPSRHFVASDIVGHALNQPGSLTTRVAQFEKDIVEPLTSLSNELKTSDPPGYIGLVKDKVVFSIVFAAIEDHQTKMIMRYWTGGEKDGKVVLIEGESHACPGECEAGDVALMGDGKEAAESDIAKHPTMWAILGFETAVRHLVEDGILDKPDSVGPPVELLRLSDRDGIQWVEDRGGCAERK